MCTCRREKRAMLSESGVRASRSSAVTWIMDYIIIEQLARSDSGRALSLSATILHPSRQSDGHQGETPRAMELSIQRIPPNASKSARRSSNPMACHIRPLLCTHRSGQQYRDRQAMDKSLAITRIQTHVRSTTPRRYCSRRKNCCRNCQSCRAG